MPSKHTHTHYTGIDINSIPSHTLNLSFSTTKYIHINSTTVYVPALGLGLSHPLSRQRVCPSPRNQIVVGTLACGWGVGESQFQRLEKKLSTLPTLCFQHYAELGTRKKYLARTPLTLNIFLLEAWKYPTILYCIILLSSLITFLRTCRGNMAVLYICIQSTHDILS
jgi:hypothetical protein